MNSSHTPDNRPPATNGELLTNLIVALNIFRRNTLAYPAGHPQIEASLERALALCAPLLQREGELRIAVARHTLVVDGVMLDGTSPTIGAFARMLFEHGIGGLTLRRGLTARELARFIALLGLRREELLEGDVIVRGGWSAEDATLQLHPVRYDLFTVVSPHEGAEFPQEDNLWERFARALMGAEGSGFRGEDGGTVALADLPLEGDEIDPRVLAAMLNRQLTDRQRCNAAAGAGTGGAVSEAMELLRGGDAGEEQGELGRKLGLFISALAPPLRRRFLEGCLDVSRVGGASLVGLILPQLSPRALAETLEDASRERLVVPPAIMELMRALAHNAAAPRGGLPHGDDPAQVRGKIRSIFREHASEEYVPASYRGKLSRVMAGEVQTAADCGLRPLLQEACDGHAIENQISDIIVCLMMEDDDPGQTEFLVENLLQMLFYLLETGDYDRLIHLIQRCSSPRIPPAARELLVEGYSSPDVLREMLAGMVTWGKSRYDDIGALIRLIGPPFIPVLLERLGEEESLSLRRFLMERIGEFGGAARGAMLDLLHDGRWYLVRNLIVLLRQLDDPTVLERLRPLMDHPHPRVRQEALICCLQLRDATAERHLLREMDNPAREEQLAAIQLAGRSRSLDVFRKLLAMVERPGFGAMEGELKGAVILTLADIGREEALPALERLLAARSLFNARSLAKLKTDAIRSLRHYPPAAVRPLLGRLASGRGEVASQAAQVLESIGERRP